MDTFSFALSSSLDTPVRIRIINLEGDEAPFPASTLFTNPALRHLGSNTSPISDLHVTVQVFAGAKPLTAPVQTAYKHFRAERRWSEWLELPIPYSTLPLNSRLAITIWDLSPGGGPSAIGHDTPFGGTTLSLFDHENLLRKGHQICTVFRSRRADGADSTTTPALPSPLFPPDEDEDEEELRELARVEALFKRHEMAEIPQVDWLDQLVFRQSEKRGLPNLRARLARHRAKAAGLHPPPPAPGSGSVAASAASAAVDTRPGLSRFVLHVELPRFDFPVVFADLEYPAPPVSIHRTPSPSEQNHSAPPPPPLIKPPPRPLPRLRYGPGIIGPAASPALPSPGSPDDSSSSLHSSPPPLFRVYDPEVGQADNPAETKHRRLFRSVDRNGIADRDLKPNSKVRDELNAIIAYPPGRDLSPEEADLIWKFRHYLSRDKRALTKFVKAVNWPDPAEARLASDVVARWAEIETDDALELLGPRLAGAPVVRAYAVSRLRKAGNDELLLYLLQLVQALRYEPIEEDQEVADGELVDDHGGGEEEEEGGEEEEEEDEGEEEDNEGDDDDGARVENEEEVDQDQDEDQDQDQDRDEDQDEEHDEEEEEQDQDESDDDASDEFFEPPTYAPSSLARFLISRAAGDFTFGNYFYWYIMVECDDTWGNKPVGVGIGHDSEQARRLYGRVAYDFMAELLRRPDGIAMRRTLLHQAEMITVLSKIATEAKSMRGVSMARRTEKVRSLLADPLNGLVAIDPPLPLPIDPAVRVTGVMVDQTTVFKSSLCPIKVVFSVAGGGYYAIIFKVGDDLRQDQLVVQIITLMDRLLQKENLDLRLSPYKILATGSTAGASQFVASASLSNIASRFRGAAAPALSYLRHHNPDPSQPLGVRRETLDAYVRSCAGYCVITYILGVGDRHLENLLLTPDGRFFHADFGFILGRDPKPFAPTVKLSREMVECMGGTQSEHYLQFKQYCYLAYAALRRRSSLILNLLGLMVDASIPDIRSEPDKAVPKVMDRFRLELTEEEAMLHFEKVIEEALAALAPVVIDRLHELVQALRG